jgi:hypothetical protein
MGHHLQGAAMKLAANEHVVAAWAEHAKGQGWNNQPLWVLVCTTDSYRLECLQPEEQTSEMRALYNISSAVTESMTGLVKAKIHREATT